MAIADATAAAAGLAAAARGLSAARLEAPAPGGVAEPVTEQAGRAAALAGDLEHAASLGAKLLAVAQELLVQSAKESTPQAIGDVPGCRAVGARAPSLGEACNPQKRHALKPRQALSGCRLAEWRAQKVLDQAAGRKVTDADVEGVLDAWEFRKNYRRVNVMRPGRTNVLSEMVGLVKIRAYQKLAVSSKTRRFPAVVKLLCRHLVDNPPVGLPRGVAFPFTTICINRDYAAARHRDTGNTGLSIIRALGPFSGGELRFWPADPGPKAVADVQDLDEAASVLHTVRGRAVMLDSTKAHSVEPFEGKRFSLVYFTVRRYDKSSAADREFLRQNCVLEILAARKAEAVWRQASLAK